MILGTVDIVVTMDGQPSYCEDRQITSEEAGMSKDIVQKLIGDGSARISVSHNLKDMDYGTGFGVQVTVSLTCNQDAETVEETFTVANSLAVEYAEVAFSTGADLFSTTIGRK